MLKLFDSTRTYRRREFLRIGGIAGGLGFAPWGLPAQLSASGPAGLTTGKSVVFLFMQGGPSQFETFDPKTTAPSNIRCATDEIATAIPGVTFGSTFPKLAQIADQMTIVRSFTTGDGNHDIKPIVGRDSGGANLGSLYARVAGTNHPTTGLPTNAALFPQSVEPKSQPVIKEFGNFESPGGLGGGYAPFVPGAGGNVQADMELKLPIDRLGDRRALLSALDQIRFSQEAQTGSRRDPLREQAFETILGGLAGAFDLSKEDPATIARYDTAPLLRPDQIDRKWNNHKHYVDHAQTLGKLMLLARRLCEAGCGFVTVTTSFVWDNHSDENNAGVAEGIRYCGVPFDHAVSTFLQDVSERGLSDRIRLVCCGEMGRTPRINARGGRDHWGGLAPLLIAGGGSPMGQVIGQSNRTGAEPASDPIRIPNLLATIMGTLFDLGKLRVTPGVPNEVLKAAFSADPIAGL